MAIAISQSPQKIQCKLLLCVCVCMFILSIVIHLKTIHTNHTSSVTTKYHINVCMVWYYRNIFLFIFFYFIIFIFNYYYTVDGQWSTWSTPSSCSVSCGDGHETLTRTCNNPPPSHGGHTCDGHSSKTQICHEQPCPGNISLKRLLII